MRSTFRFALLLAQVWTVCCQFTPVLDSATESYVAQVLEHWDSPSGIAIAVVRRDAHGQWLVETQGYGVARLDGSKNVTADTRFGIGSNSKVWRLLHMNPAALKLKLIPLAVHCRCCWSLDP